MAIFEFDGPPSSSLDASETGESTKCPWVKVVGYPYPPVLCTLPSFARIKMQDGGPSKSTIDQHLRSDGKRGDCEQSMSRCAHLKMLSLNSSTWSVCNPFMFSCAKSYGQI